MGVLWALLFRLTKETIASIPFLGRLLYIDSNGINEESQGEASHCQLIENSGKCLLLPICTRESTNVVLLLPREITNLWLEHSMHSQLVPFSSFFLEMLELLLRCDCYETMLELSLLDSIQYRSVAALQTDFVCSLQCRWIHGGGGVVRSTCVARKEGCTTRRS